MRKYFTFSIPEDTINGVIFDQREPVSFFYKRLSSMAMLKSFPGCGMKSIGKMELFQNLWYIGLLELFQDLWLVPPSLPVQNGTLQNVIPKIPKKESNQFSMKCSDMFKSFACCTNVIGLLQLVQEIWYTYTHLWYCEKNFRKGILHPKA